MPVIDWIGKDKVVNHHLDVPYHVLDRKYSFDEGGMHNEDNGSENMNHLIANKILGCDSYFCRPYCSADKGSIENRNKILRQFLSKKTNFDLISEDTIAIIQKAINDRPLKLLNWNAPSDALLFV